jgi:iron complex transport system substrate-binding protein
LILTSALPALAAHASRPARPRIVSLAPHLTELVYAVGGGDTLVGTVEYSDFPAAARALPRVGDAWRVDMERLVALHPDIVLTWTSGTPPNILERLDALHLRRVDIATFRLADLPVALQRLGDLTGTPENARTVAETFSAGIASLRSEYAKATPVTVFIQLDDQPLFTVNSHHIISEIVELCGGRNVFAALPQLAPPIAVEAVIAADPQVILSTDDTIADPAAQWRSWQRLTAVRYRTIYPIHADTVARSTPRLVQGTRETCENLADARRRLPPVPTSAR